MVHAEFFIILVIKSDTITLIQLNILNAFTDLHRKKRKPKLYDTSYDIYI